ncbi:MAG: hypothetical protein ABF297_14075 [Thiogranum sp.]
MFIRTGAIVRRLAIPVLFVLPVSLAVPSVSVAENTALSTPGTNLRQLLEEQGWQQEIDADGNTLFYPPGQESSQSTKAPPAVVPDIFQQLRERGWEIRTDTEGNTLLTPAVQSTQTPARSHPTTPASAETERPAGALSIVVPPELETLLRERGWHIETDTGGDTLLMPTGSVPSDTTNIETRQAPDPFLQFIQSLENKGWRVEPAESGAVIIFPPVQADELPSDRGDPLQPDQRGHSQWIELEAIATGEIELPVDGPGKAKKLAGAWIDNFGLPGLSVGKVRQINHVYAVSIVDSETPYWLRNQLIIRSNDGGVIVVY